MFTAKVTYRKKYTGEVTFKDGVLSGEPMLVHYLRNEAEYRDSTGAPVGNWYNYRPSKHISDALSIRLLIEEIFDNVTFYGDIPKDAELEEGNKG